MAKKRFSAASYLETELNEKIEAAPDIFDDLNCVYQLTVGDENWHLDLRAKGKRKIVSGCPEKADCRIGMSIDNLEKLAAGKLNIPLAIAFGKFKISGNPKLALKLVELFK